MENRSATPQEKSQGGIPRIPLNPNQDLLTFRGPSGNVSICALFTSFPLLTLLPTVDTRYAPYAPTPTPESQMFVLPQGSPGLFGPRSPCNALCELEPQLPLSSWAEGEREYLYSIHIISSVDPPFRSFYPACSATRKFRVVRT